MSTRENETLLQLRINELEKQLKDKNKEIKKKDKIISTIGEDNLVMSKALRSTTEKLRVQLFLKFGNKSEKYKKLFNIPKSYSQIVELDEENLTEAQLKVIREGQVVVDKIQQQEDFFLLNKVNSIRNRNPNKRKRGNSNGKQKFDLSYPRKDVIVDIHNKECPRCKTNLIYLNTDNKTEYIDLLEKSLEIIREIRPKYYCPNCGVSKNSITKEESKEIICAPTPKDRFIPGGLAGNNLIAMAMCDKYFYGLSSYRLASRFKNFGIDISEQNLSNWFIKASEELFPLADEILKDLLNGKAINADETRYMVLDEIDREDTSKSWMWVLSSPDVNKPKVYFKYDPSRSSDVFKSLVGDYDGYVQSDCYAGYQAKKQDYKFKLALCLAHLRRRYTDALKAGNYKEGSPGYITINKVLTIIGKIYDIDKTERELFIKGICNEEEFIKKRKQLSLIQFDKLTKVTNGRKDYHLNDEYLLDGLNYYLNHQELFPKYLEIAELNPDNSRVERIIKAFARIRANTLFAGSPRGAKAMATLQTVIQTANVNDMNLGKYMKYLLDNISLMRNSLAAEVNYTKLLPWNLDKQIKDELSVDTMSIKYKKF